LILWDGVRKRQDTGGRPNGSEDETGVWHVHADHGPHLLPERPFAVLDDRNYIGMTIGVKGKNR